MLEAGEQYGFINIFIPFVLIFSVIFMLLEVSGVFKKGANDTIGTKINAAFAFGYALMAMANEQIINWFTTFIPNASFLLLVFMLFAIALALLVPGKDGKSIFKEHPTIAGIIGIIVLAVLVYFSILPFRTPSVSRGTGNSVMNAISSIFTPDLVALLITLAAFIVFVAWFTKS